MKVILDVSKAIFFNKFLFQFGVINKPITPSKGNIKIIKIMFLYNTENIDIFNYNNIL